MREAFFADAERIVSIALVANTSRAHREYSPSRALVERIVSIALVERIVGIALVEPIVAEHFQP